MVDVVLSDLIEVEAECKADAVAEAVRRAVDFPGALCVEATVVKTAEVQE